MKFCCCLSVLLLLVATGNCASLSKGDVFLGTVQKFPGKSCAHIYDNNLASRNKSGLYWVTMTTNETVQVHCEMGLSVAGANSIVWTKIADITGDNCPAGWEKISIPRSTKQACKGNSDRSDCYPIHIKVDGHNFNEVYGKVVGIQKGVTTAFNTHVSKYHNIDDQYVDGVSITYGNPRQHLWTYATGYSSGLGSYSSYNCPCSYIAGGLPPAFVGEHYYCQSGSSGIPSSSSYYPDVMLWDGKGCPSGNSCCAQQQMPYFYRRLPVATEGKVQEIEVRICQDQTFSNAATLVSELEIFIGLEY